MTSVGSVSIQLKLDRTSFDSDLKKLSQTNAPSLRVNLDVKDFERQIKGLNGFIPTVIVPVKLDIDSQRVKRQFEDIGKNAAAGFAQGFAGAEGAGKSAIDSMVKSVRSQLGIASPSKVFRQIGRHAADGLIEGLQVDKSKLRGVVKSIEQEFKSISIDLEPNFNGLQKKIKPLKGSIDLQLDFGDISKAVEKGVRGASSKNIFAALTGGLLKAVAGIGTGLLSVLLLPLKAAAAGIGTVFVGAGLKLGEELSSGVSSGIKSAIGSALSSSIGSSSIVGEAIGEGIVESLGAAFKRLMPGLMSEVAEQARQVLGEEKVFTADAVRRSQSSASANKNKQTATEQIQSDYQRVVSQGKPARLKQLGAEIGAVLPGIQQDSQAFVADFAAEQQRLQKTAERFKVKLTPEKLIKRRVKEYEEQVKTFEKLAAQLEVKGEVGKADKIRSALAAIPRPDTDPTKVSKEELQFQEAKYLGEIQAKFVNRELNRQFSGRRVDLARRKRAIAPQLQEYEQLFQELGGIGRASEVLGVAPVAKTPQKDALPIAYQKIFQQVAQLSGVGEIPASMIPRLQSSTKLRPGVYGSYTPETNRVNVPPEVYQLIQKGQLNPQIIETLVHELRHALQFGVGQTNPLVGESAAVPLLTPTPQEARKFGKFIEGSTTAQPEQAKPAARKLESDAYVFAARNTPQIAAKIQKESAIEQFQKSFGVAGANAEKLVKNLQIEAAKKIQPIQGLVEQYGATLQQEIAQTFTQFENLAKSLEPLLNKAANIESLSAEEITRLQEELGSSLSAIVAQIEATPAKLKQEAIAKVQATKSRQPTEDELVKQIQQKQGVITANLKQSFKGKPSDRKVVNQELAGSTLTDIDEQIAFVAKQLERTDLSPAVRQKLGQFRGTIERQYRSYSPALRRVQKSQIPVGEKNVQPVTQKLFDLPATNNSETELFSVADDADKILAALKEALLSVSPKKRKGKRVRVKLKTLKQARKELAELEIKIDKEVRQELEQLTDLEKATKEPSLPSNEQIESQVQARQNNIDAIRKNPRKFLRQRSKSAVVQKARYITENAEGIANLVGTKVGESPNVEQTKSLLNLQDAFSKVGEASTKFGQNQSDKNFKALSAAVRELEGALRKLGLPFELINQEIDAYTNKLKKMQSEGKIDVEVDVSSLAPEKFSFVDNLLAKFSTLEARGIKAIGSILKGFLAFGALTFVQQIFTGLATDAFKAYVELDKLKTALNFGSGGSAGGAQNLAFIKKQVDELKVPLKASVEGFSQLASAARGSALQGQGTRDLFLGISQASTVLSLSADETKGAILALSQIISKGKVSAEELRGQLGERIPGALGIASRALGVTEQEFSRLLDTGSILSEDFLPKFAKQLQAEFGDAAKDAAGNAQSAIFDLQNSFLGLQQGVGEGVAPAAIAGLSALSGIIKGLSAVSKELGFILLGVSVALSVKMAGALKAVIIELIATKAATGTLGGAFTNLAQSVNNSFSVKLTAGIFAVLEVINLLNQAVNTELVQSFDKAAQAAKRSAEESRKAFEKPTSNQQSSPEPVASSGVGRFLDKYLIGFLNTDVGPLKGGNPFTDEKFSTYGQLEQSNVNNSITGITGNNADFLVSARTRLNQLKSGQGNIGQLPVIDSALRDAEIQRQTLQADIKRNFIDKGIATPAEDKRRLEAQNLRITDLNNQRSDIAKPFNLDLSRADQRINDIKSQVEALKNPDNIAAVGGGEVASKLTEQLNASLEKLKQFKAEAEATLAALRVDPVLAFTNALRKLNLAFAESQENNEQKFNQQRAAIASNQLTGFSRNALAGRNATLQTAIAERDRNSNNVLSLQNAVDATDKTVNAPEFQATLKRLGVTPDATVAKIDDVLKNTQDEADKGILEKLKAVREQRNKLSEARVGLSESQLKVKQVTQDNSLFSIDEGAAKSRATAQKNENELIASIRNAQEAKVLVEEVANEKIARIQLQSTKRQQKSIGDQLIALRTYYEQGQVSAEEFAKRERDLTVEQTNLEKQEAENRLGIQQATLQRRLKEIETANKTAELTLGINQTQGSIAVKNKLLSSGITVAGQDQAALEQNAVDQKAQSDRINLIKTRIAQNKQLYKEGLRDEREFAIEELALNQELAQANLQLVDLKIGNEEKYREIVERNISRIMQLEDARFKNLSSKLDESKANLDLYNQSLERTAKLQESRASLGKALSDAIISPLEIKKDNASRALDLSRKLKDENLDPGVRNEVNSQLNALGFGSNEIQILQQRSQIEDEIAAKKLEALKIEQAYQKQALELDLKRQRIAAETAVYDAQSAQLSAAKSKLEQEAALRIAIAKKDDVGIKSAQIGLEIAQREINLSDKRLANSLENLAAQDELASNATKAQEVTQKTAIDQQLAADGARKQANALELVESSVKKIDDSTKKTDPNKRGRVIKDGVDITNYYYDEALNIAQRNPRAPGTDPVEAIGNMKPAPGLQLSNSLDINPLPKLNLKPGEDTFAAYQRMRETPVPTVDKVKPAVSDRVSAFGEALKIANKEVVQRLDKLIDSISTVAKSPRSLTVQTPSPVDDAAKILSDMQRGSMAAAGL